MMAPPPSFHHTEGLRLHHQVAPALRLLNVCPDEHDVAQRDDSHAAYEHQDYQHQLAADADGGQDARGKPCRGQCRRSFEDDVQETLAIAFKERQQIDARGKFAGRARGRTNGECSRGSAPW